MSALEAARLGDQIGHTSALKGLIAGLVVGFVVTGLFLLAVGATVATGGAAAVVIGALIAGTAGGGLAGMKIGATFDSDPKGPIITGSPNTFLGTFAKPAARATRDQVQCMDHALKFIAQGSTDVFINQLPAARRTDMTVCSGKIREGQPDVFFGGPTGTYMELESEVPGWLVTTLTWAAWIGVGIATGGAILTVGFGAAMIGLGGSMLGGWGGGWLGGHIGKALGGARGEAIGEAIGGFAGSILGGAGAGKLANRFVEVPRTPQELAASRPAKPDLPVKPISEVQARLTPQERAIYQESMRIATQEPIQAGPKTFYAGKGGPEAAEAFIGKNPEYVRLESGTRAGKMLDQNSKLLEPTMANRNDQRLPYNPPEGVAADGYGVKPWTDVSVRYTRAAEGPAHAFAENAGPHSVFRNGELPELLYNPKVNEVHFHNNDGSTAGVWRRSGPNGTWEGPVINNKGGVFDIADPKYAGGANTPITKPATPATPLPTFPLTQDPNKP